MFVLARYKDVEADGIDPGDKGLLPFYSKDKVRGAVVVDLSAC